MNTLFHLYYSLTNQFSGTEKIFQIFVVILFTIFIISCYYVTNHEKVSADDAWETCKDIIKIRRKQLYWNWQSVYEIILTAKIPKYLNLDVHDWMHYLCIFISCLSLCHYYLECCHVRGNYIIWWLYYK